MKKLSVIAIVSSAAFLMQACGDDVQRKPSRVYMPDMAYSVAYETYSDYHSRLGDSIFYNARPVAGTVKRGEEAYHYEMLADTTGSYDKSAAMKNPLPQMDAEQLTEAERLYLVNCGVCHGQKLDGNGPLYKGGEGPYPAAPANFIDPKAGGGKYYAMAEGTMFHSITYGKNLMGSYASQVTPKQRWMIVSYIKSKQALQTAQSTPVAAAAPAAPAAKDTTKK